MFHVNKIPNLRQFSDQWLTVLCKANKAKRSQLKRQQVIKEYFKELSEPTLTRYDDIFPGGLGLKVRFTP